MNDRQPHGSSSSNRRCLSAGFWRLTSQRRSRRGFTLIELLIVIGIISVLIAILLPALSKARESANRIVCLSNLRQVYLACSSYASDSKDQVPIGCEFANPYSFGGKTYNGGWQSNYIMFETTYGKMMLLGRLYAPNRATAISPGYKSPYIADGHIFYCPSAKENPAAYNSAVNVWYPGSSTTIATRSGYGCRPLSEWSSNDGDPARFPRLSQQGQSALIADEFSLPANVTMGHRDGVNVLFGDASAHWVPLSVLSQKPVQPGAPNFSAVTSLSNTYDPTMDNIWSALDGY